MRSRGTLRAQEPPPPPGHPEHHPEWRDHRGPGNPLEALKERLKLSDEQQAKIKPIIEGAAPVLKQIREEERAKMEGAIDVAASQIRSILNDEQKEEFERMVDELKKGPPGGPHGPPPPPKGHRPPPRGDERKPHDGSEVAASPAPPVQP